MGRARGIEVDGRLALGLALAIAACAEGDAGPQTGAASTGEPTTGPTSGATSGTEGVGPSSTASGSGAGSTTGSGGDGAGAAGPGGGGATTGGGGDGAGGTSSSSASAGGDGGGTTGTGTGGGGGGPGDPVVTLLAVAPTEALAASRSPEGDWDTTPLSGAFASSRPALAMVGPTDALGLVRTSGNALHHTRWQGADWAALTAVPGAPTTRDTPALGARTGVAHLAWHRPDFFHVYARWDGSFGASEEVGPAGSTSFGPTAPAVAPLGDQPVVAFAGDDDGLYAQIRGGSTWNGATGIVGAAADLTPALASLAGDVPLLVATTPSTTLVWSRRTGGAWSSAVAVAADALSSAPPALAAIDGGAVLAYRGTNGGVYASVFDAGAGSWSAPERVVAAVTTPSTPAVARGVGAASAELAYVDAASGAAMHVRRIGGAWGAPTVVGGRSLTGVALASPP